MIERPTNARKLHDHCTIIAQEVQQRKSPFTGESAGEISVEADPRSAGQTLTFPTP